MWTRRAKQAGQATAPRPAVDVAPDSEAPIPASSEEHPALLRIRRANELVEAMRPSGGRHREQT